MKRSLPTLLVLAAALPVALLAAPAASAYTTAYNSRDQWLSAKPTVSMHTVCNHRQIYLATGDYSWVTLVPHSPQTGRPFGFTREFPAREPLFLAAGTYDWRTCIVPFNGRYEVQDTLTNPWGGSVRLTGHTRIDAAVPYTQLVRWGSRLRPLYFH